jgi:DNA topoisomerase-1
VVSHEITTEGIMAAFQSPREIDMALVDAQQARRVLDRLVGFTLSPLIAKKLLYRGLSAGRVQSAALRMVVEREREIEAFVPRESWSVEAALGKEAAKGGKAETFTAELHALAGQRGRLSMARQQDAQRVAQELVGASYAVDSVTRRQVRRRPAPPFITSTLQQAAGQRLRFTASRTMQVAQQLYEGLALGGDESVGLITYMRTDSTNVAQSAQREARAYLRKAFGPEYVPSQTRVYRTKVKGAQEAHEAIRPTSVLREPRKVQPYLNSAQFRLYELVWQRFLASQAADAVGDSSRVEVAATCVSAAPTYLFRATGLIWTFLGFRRIYLEQSDDAHEDGAERTLPPLTRGEPLDCLGLEQRQHFTQPPPRYTEASLIRAMEEKGIGRPSTYANIVSTIQQRGYVKRERNSLRPLLLGPVVNDLLTQHFSRVVDLGFTARMEEELDEIARGERDWQDVLRAFYDPFIRDLKEAEERIPRRGIEVGEDCEVCGRPMILKRSKWGKNFFSCSGFPECRNAKPIEEKVGMPCPRCAGELVERKAQKGKRRSTFYGCNRYPECDFTTNQRPLPEPCPNCEGLLVQQGRSQARCLACDYRGPVPEAVGEPVLVEA